MNVFSHSVDEAAAHPSLAARRAGIDGLSPDCRACPIVRACGGGLYAHRYRSGSGFDNPSVYCADLKVLIPQVTSAPRRAAQAERPPGPAARDGEEASAHRLDAEAFDLLSAGPGDRVAMAALSDAMYSVNRALVGAVAWPHWRYVKRAGSGGRRRTAAAFQARCRASGSGSRGPHVPVCPGVGGALPGPGGRCRHRPPPRAPGRGRRGGGAAGGNRDRGDRTGPRRCHSPARSAAPSSWPAGTGPVAPVRVSPSGVTAASSTGEWQAVRRVPVADRPVTLDDVDPFRDCQAWVAAGRLPDLAWEAWSRALPAAFSRLATELPGYADVLRAGLRSVVPILPAAAGPRQSGSARHAFGSVAVAFPADPGSLSELLLHEMQHVKLAALANLFDLFNQADGSLFAVPWRPDRRPFEGLLHGAYAHLAVAELWRARAMAAPDRLTMDRYRTYRSWVEDAIATMLTAGCLRPAGVRFVEGMHATVKGWTDDG